MNYVKLYKHLCVKKILYNADVFIGLVQSIPEKPKLSMIDLLKISSKQPPRSRDRGLKKDPKITSTPSIKNRVRPPAPASSDSSPDSTHRSSCSRSFAFSYLIPSRRFYKSPPNSLQRSESRSRSRLKSPNRLPNQGHRNGGNAVARKNSASFLNRKFPMPEAG